MDNIYQRIVSLQRNFRSYVDQPQAPAARSLEAEIQRLEDEAQVGKNPRSLEDRIKGIIRQLKNVNDSAVIDDRHANDLRDQLEEIRSALRSIS